MSDHSLNHEHRHFRDWRERLTGDAKGWDGEQEATLRSGAVLAVGLLLGGGFPAAAAAVSVILDARFPAERWPWSGGPA